MTALKRCKSLFLWDGCAFWPAIYIMARSLYWYEPWHDVPIESFDRSIGQATLADQLISGRTGNAMLTLLVWVPLLLVLGWLVASLCFGPGRRYEQRREFSGWISAFSGIGMIGMTLDYLYQFGIEDDIWMREAQAVPLAIVLCSLIWCLFLRFAPEEMSCMYSDSVKQYLLCGMMLGFPVHMLARFQNFTAVVCGVCTIVALILCITMSRFKPDLIGQYVRTYAGIPLLLMLPAMLLYLEIGNILNQYNIFVGKNHGPLVLIAVACMIASAVIGGVLRGRLQTRYAENIAFNRKLDLTVKDWRDVWYPVILVSLALLAGYNELQTYVGSDFFERANSAVSISGFLNFGQIPAVETHGAHMGIDYFGGIFWGLVNGDPLAASFMKYNGIPMALTILVFYYLLRRCIGPDAALVASMVLPVINTSHSAGDWFAHIAYLPVVVLPWVIEKPSFRRYALFWGSAAFSVLYRGDIGLALGVGAVLVMTAFVLLQKSLAAIKQYLLSFACVGGGLAAVLVVLCLIRGINPVSRLWEFLEMMAGSNQNWAYNSIGIPGSSAMAWTYFVTPLLLLALTITCILRLVRRQTALRSEHWLFFVFTAGYYMNFPRTLVRHSLLENVPVYCLAMGMWALALGVWLLWRDRDPERRPGGTVLPAAMMLTLVVTTVCFNAQLMGSTTLFTMAHNKLQGGEIVFPQLVDYAGNSSRQLRVREKVSRVVLPAEMKSTANSLERVLDEILKEDETWVDFTNQSTLYALLQRRSPVYVNQSPGMLSGDYTQKCFVEQVEKQKDKVPVALLPQTAMTLGFSMDGVNTSLRYYRVAEYIFNNYVPYKTVDKFSVWVRPERLAELRPAENEETGTESNRMDLNNQSFRVSNAEMVVDESGISIRADGDDPIIDNFQSLLTGNGLKSGQATVTIYYTSDTTGDLQLFYAEPARNYEEKNSIRVPVQETGDSENAVQLVFEWNNTKRLRLDTPAHSNFTITGISTDSEVITTGGYGYGSMSESHTYQLGAVARLWGEQDEQKAWLNPQLAKLQRVSGLTYAVPEELTGGENGRYIKLVIKAATEGSASLSLARTADRAVTYATFVFDVAEGTHTYLIRVSCDSYWYSGMVNAVNYAGPALQSISILEGD